MDKLVDMIENMARFMKARHYGEILLFVLSLLLMAFALTTTLTGRQLQPELSQLEESIRYLLTWFGLLSVHVLILSVTLTVLLKKWGNRRLVIIALLFQGVSLLVLLTNLPLR